MILKTGAVKVQNSRDPVHNTLSPLRMKSQLLSFRFKPKSLTQLSILLETSAKQALDSDKDRMPRHLRFREDLRKTNTKARTKTKRMLNASTNADNNMITSGTSKKIMISNATAMALAEKTSLALMILAHVTK